MLKVGHYSKYLKNELSKMESIHQLHMFVILIFFINTFFIDYRFFKFVISILLTFIFYKFYERVKNGLQYTYWTMSTSLLIYLVIKFFSIDSISAKLLLVLASCFILYEVYILSSPLYYPRISWWEYDFRFRDDIFVNVLYEEKFKEARLTDLRREACCIASFQNFKVGSSILIQIDEIFSDYQFEGKVMSKRRPLPGRPIIYGISLSLNSSEEKENYNIFKKFWINERQYKINQKFKES